MPRPDVYEENNTALVSRLNNRVVQEWSSSQEDASESSLAAHAILQSIPAHVLKALESQQALAKAVNAETQVDAECLWWHVSYLCLLTMLCYTSSSLLSSALQATSACSACSVSAQVMHSHDGLHFNF